jgi:hypothetical protein
MSDDTYIHKCRVIVVAWSSRGEVGSDQKVLPWRLWAEIRGWVASKPQRISCNRTSCNKRHINLLASATAVLEHHACKCCKTHLTRASVWVKSVSVWRLTSKIGSQLAIAEPPRGHTVLEVSAIGREVRLDEGVEVVIVTYVDRWVAECEERRHERLRFATMRSHQKEYGQEQQAPRLHWDRLLIESVVSLGAVVARRSTVCSNGERLWALYKWACTDTKRDDTQNCSS